MEWITSSIIVIVVACLAQGFLDENIGFCDADEDELIKQAIETLEYLKQHNRPLESSIITADLVELKDLIQLIPLAYGYGRSIALRLQMEDVKLCLRKEIFNAYYQPDNIGCLKLSTLSKYVVKLGLEISLDSSNSNIDDSLYQRILKAIAEKAMDLEQLIQQADSKNSTLAEMLLKQYYQIRDEYLQAREALPYFQQAKILEEIADFFQARIRTDVSQLKAKNLTFLAEELEQDSNVLQKMANDLIKEQNLSAIINRTSALRIYEQSLQQRLYEIETQNIPPQE